MYSENFTLHSTARFAEVEGERPSCTCFF